MSQRRKRLSRKKRINPALVVLAVLCTVGAIGVVAIAGGTVVASATVNTWLKDLPDYTAPGAFDVAQATKIYSADGKLLARLYLENREVIPISEMTTGLVDAAVAIEDERFYSHDGVDIVGIARAAVKNLSAGSIEEGASTITQQYVRNTILIEERTDIELSRKVREAFLAMELEKRYDKTQILEMYLNAIYFGDGAYGVEAASQTYFSKPASELTLPEAALLAGLPQQPNRLSPFDNPEGAKARRNEVLSRMLKNGYIDRTQYDAAVATPLQPKRSDEPENGIYEAPYFVAHVKKQLQEQFSEAVVFKGGLTVETTLDTRMQAAAETALKENLPEGPDGALVSLDPRTGYVKAMVGGRDYDDSKFNLATQAKRQPGSSFKTFVLVTALAEGMPPSYQIDSSSPAYIPTKPEPWTPSNSEGSGHGPMSLAAATRSSVNTVFARLTWALGADKVAKTAKKMGITTKLPNYPSIGLGAANVTVLEMASAYGTLANEGVHEKPISYTKVTDATGKVIFEADSKGERSISPEIAKATTDVLEGVITSGTARRARIGRPAAGKTGTSQNNRDAWFVGYTPQLSTAVWVGYRVERTIYVNGRRAYGGTVCAPIWADFMSVALKGQPKLDFKDADQPEYDASKFKVPSGKKDPEEPVEEKPIAPTPVPVPEPVPAPAPEPVPAPIPTPPPSGETT